MKFKLIIAFLVFQSGFSQQRTCATNSYMQQMMKNPVDKRNHLEFQQKFEIELLKLKNEQNNSAKNTNATIIVPVAVHFPDVAPTSTDKECLKQLAQNQLDILNKDFNATNSDITLWTPAVSSFYPGTNLGVFDVKFVLATQNHPANTGLVNGQVAVTFGTSFVGNDYDQKWKYYLNIVVTSMGGGGYSPKIGRAHV